MCRGKKGKKKKILMLKTLKKLWPSVYAMLFKQI